MVFATTTRWWKTEVVIAPVIRHWVEVLASEKRGWRNWSTPRVDYCCSHPLWCSLVSYLPIDDDVEHYYSVNIGNHGIDLVRAVVDPRVNLEEVAMRVESRPVAPVPKPRLPAVGMEKVSLPNLSTFYIISIPLPQSFPPQFMIFYFNVLLLRRQYDIWTLSC